MPEHQIRLRGGWLQVDPHAPPDASESGRRLTLPCQWPGAPAGRVRLVRSFGPPPLDASHETLSLRFEAVGGLVSARLNGREIARPAAGTTPIEIPLPDPLPRRNLLILDVDVDPLGPSCAVDRWGIVSLVIRPRDLSAASRFDRGIGNLPGAIDRDERELLGGIDSGA